MLTERMMLLSTDLYDYTFQMVDGENEAYGNDAGRIATAVQKAFEYEVMSDDPDALAERIILDAQRDGTLEFRLECWPEETYVRGNAMCSGDDEEDERVENAILAELEAGNTWAWCTVRVSCRIPDYALGGQDFLGCCNYANEADFKDCGYYEDMCEQARQDLQSHLSEYLAKR